MSRKILTVLAPVVAIVAFMAVPSLAQATQTVTAQCGASECAVGAEIIGQSTNLVTVSQEQPSEEKISEIVCKNSEFTGTVTTVQGTHATGKVTKDSNTGCTSSGFTTHIKTNASAANPWTLQIQQPDEVTGKFQAHLTGNIQFEAQPQFIGSVTTCDYSATDIQFNGSVQNDSATVEGVHQFMRQSGSTSLCGQWGTLTGTVQLEDKNKNPVVIHH